MKHIVMSAAWAWGTDPFPTYRANLSYGRNKFDRQFLPVQGITPAVELTVTDYWDRKVLYVGTDRAEADKAKATYDAKDSLHFERAHLKEGQPILPENKFRVIKTRDKGTILVVAGADTTNRCLLFVGCSGGFRGGVGLLDEGTTAQILKEASAGNACESSCEVIALLEVGQTVAFHTSGRRSNEVYVYTWTGTETTKTHFSKEEWDQRKAAAQTPEDAEVL